MTPDDLRLLTRARPFRAFRIHGSDGRARDVMHPDECRVSLTVVTLPLGKRDGAQQETLEHLALSHIVRLEELVPAGA